MGLLLDTEEIVKLSVCVESAFIGKKWGCFISNKDELHFICRAKINAATLAQFLMASRFIR
eukprot:scaffold119846_cov93-Cyclotella_meneghiniana.AAC.4